jgi:hypothetical protein
VIVFCSMFHCFCSLLFFQWIVPIESPLTAADARPHIAQNISSSKKQLSDSNLDTLAAFVCSLHAFYMDYACAFLEINPFVLLEGTNKVLLFVCLLFRCVFALF